MERFGQIPDRAIEDGTIGWFGAIDDNEGGKTSRYNFTCVSLISIMENSPIRFFILNISLRVVF